MQEVEIYKELTKIFHDIFDDNSILLSPETSAVDIAEWDSLNHINLIVAVQARFGIKFRTSELESTFNVDGLVKMIEEKLSGHKLNKI